MSFYFTDEIEMVYRIQTLISTNLENKLLEFIFLNN